MATNTDKKTDKVVVYNGQLAPEELQALKDKLGVKQLHYIEVKMDAEGKDYACGYIQVTDNRNILAFALGKISNKDKIGAGEYILANCWVAGDDRLKNDGKASISAAIEALESVELLDASSKKV
jgi:uncharacterized ubiquitin-like protein YukD